MSENIIIALISGLFSILVALVTIYHRDVFSIFRFRKRRIKGTWTGQGFERLLNSNSLEWEETYDIRMEFQQLGSRITGKGSGKSSLGEYYEANLKGKMEDEHFMILTAHSISLQEFDISVMLLELNAKGTKLHGYSLSNGLTEHGITLSEIFLTKEPS